MKTAFHGSIKGGRFVPNSEPYYHHHLSKLEGKEVSVVVMPKKRTRSHPQNNTYWWWLGIMSEHCGHTPDELHRIFKGLYLPKKFIKIGKKEYSLAGSTTD